jgi:hypothetical protein
MNKDNLVFVQSRNVGPVRPGRGRRILNSTAWRAPRRWTLKRGRMPLLTTWHRLPDVGAARLGTAEIMQHHLRRDI